jgi:hypothetical protein
MVNYANSKIYKLICNKTGSMYIGSTTCKLCVRLAQHRKLYKAGLSGTSKLVLQNGDFNIFLIEDFPCERKEQLLARERYYIETLDCVNKKVPLRTQKQWYEDNKDRLIKKQIMWNNANRDKVKEYQAKFKANKAKGIVINLDGDETLGDDNEHVKLVIEDIYEGHILESEEDIYAYIESKFNNLI